MFQWLSRQKDYNVIILDKNSILPKGTVLSEKKINVVLSPSYYWFIEKKLPIKFTFQAKEYLPSIFESLTPSGKLSYLAIPKGDTFWLFAYDDQKIIKALEDNGINISNVEKIYFAQNVFSKDAIDLENDYSLVDIKGTITRVPTALVNVQKYLSKIPKNEFVLTNGVNLKRYKSFIDEKILYKVFIPLSLLILLYAVEIVKLWHINKNLSEQKEKIFSQYNLPSTTFQNRSILERLENIYKKQKNIREFISVVLSAPYRSNEFIKLFSLDKNSATLRIKLAKISDADIFKNYFEQRLSVGNIKSMSVNSSILTVEFTL